MTKFQLAELLFRDSLNSFGVSMKALNLDCDDILCHLQAIQREDGSGSSFNVSVNSLDGPKTIYVRTID